MANVTVKITGAKNTLRKQIKFVTKLADKQLERMAEATAETMKNKIRESITRANSSGRLENSIFSQKLGEMNYGVGNISYLNQNAPYWRHVNYGSTAIGASHSHRVPTGGFEPGFQSPTAGGSGGRWFLATGGSSFRPSRPIAPRNYIAKTLREIPRIIRAELKRGV